MMTVRLTPEDHRAIGAMLCVGVRGADADDPALRADLEACAAAHVGGVILFDIDVPTLARRREAGVPEAQARQRAVRNIIDPQQVQALVRHLRSRLGDRLLVAIDQEGGAVARLRSERGFHDDPAAADVAALPSDERARAADRQAAQLAQLGVALNFAPCVDVAVNRSGPAIGRLGRAYSDDPDVVIECARTVIAAHHRHGVACCAKHFPGHGSATGDTHRGLVDVTSTFDAEAELQPYRALLPGAEAPDAVMAAHVLCNSLDPDMPASLSRPILTGLLRETLGFRGVIATDSLDMRAITDAYRLDEAVIAAINAGADLLVHACNMPGGTPEEAVEQPAPAMHEAVVRALRDDLVDGGLLRIHASARRIGRLRGPE